MQSSYADVAGARGSTLSLALTPREFLRQHIGKTAYVARQVISLNYLPPARLANFVTPPIVAKQFRRSRPPAIRDRMAGPEHH